MRNRYKKYTGLFFAVLGGGLVAGVVNGLFGTGGGIIIVYLLSRLYAESCEYQTKDIFAMTVGSVLIMSAASLVMYARGEEFSLSEATDYLLPAAIGGLIGAFLLDRTNATLMKKIFAVLVIYAGITLIFR